MKRNNPPSKSRRWAEQDDAFFGSTKPKETNVGNRSKNDVGKERKVSGDKKERKKIPDFSLDLQKERLTSIAGKATSKISALIQEGKNAANQQFNDRNTNNEHNSSQYATSTAKSVSKKQQGNGPVNVARNNQKLAPPRKLPPPNKTNRKTITRTLRNVVVSQVPLPCAYCNAMPLAYQCHPFFGPSQRICSHHDFKTIPKCLSCHKFQRKNGTPFHEIGTTGSLLCPSCARTAILDDIAAKELYQEILAFFQSLGLQLFNGIISGMVSVPVKLYSTQQMSTKFNSFKSADSADKYGVCCWSEVHSPLGVAAGLIGAAGQAAARGLDKFVHKQRKSSKGKIASNDDGGSSERNVARNPFGGGRFVSISQIAALKGLPKIFLGEILAHEATHAWLALNPTRKEGVVGENVHFGVVRRIPMLVEEGCCQLVARLYLDRLQDDNTFPDDSLLIQYRLWAIENHSIFEYGEGYKQAAIAYNQIVENGGNLEDLLQYVSMHLSFPPHS